MVENERFQGLDGQRYPVLEFDGQNQTEARVGWPKVDFFLFLLTFRNFETLNVDLVNFDPKNDI